MIRKPPLFRLRPAALHVRGYAVQTPGAPTLQVFDRHTKWQQKERAAQDVETSRKVDYLRDEVAFRLCERLLDINRNYDKVLDLGANACHIAKALTRPNPDADSLRPVSEPIAARIKHLVAAESSASMLYRDDSLPFNSEISITRDVLQDEESLPYPANTFDAVLSASSLHWINDLPSVLTQINHVLKPDAPFLGVMFGGDTLFELRTSLQLASLDRLGGISTHTSPLADVRDIGGLLQRAGFRLLTVDVDDLVVDFPDVYALMEELQAMGEQNAVRMRSGGPLSRDVLLAADGIYKEMHGNEDGSIPATFRLIYMIGWKEGEGQQRPLERGSGMVSIKDVLEGKTAAPKGGERK
ncbi:S-adenosyl-L-methionine-dependent methyltransferase [Eremomyces bilateralis CBS 781.70]|uniref:S-adenosyl-L-methionine-dependent methyltransferase n=1 Tax=Eremomyces bilateralis CBS 781.70 TaxID=1392243 RepID=A0A6G1GDL5_9PEZI|nr:S-adenosyl-L-methionine-dependent methyltransferase [Eremomyces bilateralis CBS 781.70]KAF1816112.1 S-adenosyl-L-methionine-dependent methyltransferase [Eremomyces bilateralis CBS 781.70]